MIAFFRKALKKKKNKLKVALCAYTGKAARVLEARLKENGALLSQDKTGTIHSLIYEPETDAKGRIISWRKRNKLKVDLIIVDEASMVDKKIWEDLLSFGIPILAVGDHGQLPPIRGDFNLMENPKLKLEKIHRQAKGNPIIALSVKVRQGKQIPFGDFGQVIKLDKTKQETRELVEPILRDYSQDLMVLVGYNHSRVMLNQEIRRLIDKDSPEPQRGDLVICLRNNHRKGIYNGMRGEILEIQPKKNKKGEKIWYQLEAMMDNDVFFSGKVFAGQFNNKETISHVPGLSYKKMGDLFDFGYVLTVHKAQGSQAKKVLLFEQRFKQMDDEQWHRWLYTAVTRAEEELVIVG
jgi:exodeoxyribonuclease-5